MLITSEEATTLFYKTAQNLLEDSDKSSENFTLFPKHLPPPLFCPSFLPRFIPCLYFIYFSLT